LRIFRFGAFTFGFGTVAVRYERDRNGNPDRAGAFPDEARFAN
jgi:hypothetical protein